ncbi:MAG: response regulator [Desulfohalobiaceae bacterium]
MNKPTIAIVEDEVDILNLLRFNLESAGYSVLTALEGNEAVSMIRRELPDLVLLDIMLPGKDGFDVCKAVKSDDRTKGIPVIMLTARGEEVDRIVGLELGADDYVVKPFSPRELVLRVKAVLRRTESTETTEAVWMQDQLRVELDSHRVFIDDAEVYLTATEFKLLAELIGSKGRVQTRDQLLNNVWGYQFEGYARTVDTHVRRLRQKLGPYAELVQTVRGVGYRLKAER